MTLQDFLKTPYARNARGPEALDCWGQVRLARVHLFSKPDLPMFNAVASGDVRRMTRVVAAAVHSLGFQKVSLRPGAIATAWTDSLCWHVGIVVPVDGRLMVLDTNDKVGPRLSAPRAFENRFTRVEFYDH